MPTLLTEVFEVMVNLPLFYICLMKKAAIIYFWIDLEFLSKQTDTMPTRYEMQLVINDTQTTITNGQQLEEDTLV